MKLLSKKDLNKIRKNNQASDEEWKVVKSYLSTGKVASKEEALICYQNILNNKKWYQKDLSIALYDANNDIACGEAVIIISGMVVGIVLIILTIASFYFANVFPPLFCIPLISFIGTPSLIKVTKKAWNFIVKSKIRRVVSNLESNLAKNLENNLTAEKSENQKTQEKTSTMDKERKWDSYYVEINKTIKKIITLKYPGYENDYNNLNQMALQYLSNEYVWSELSLPTKQRLIQEIELYNAKVELEEEKLSVLADSRLQYQTLVGNVVEEENQASLKRRLEKK